MLLVSWLAEGWANSALAQDVRPKAIAWLNADTSPFAGAGVKFALGRPVDDPGPMLMIAAGTDGAMLLAGYQRMVLDVHAFAGLGPEIREAGRLGVRAHIELWAQPFERIASSLVVGCGTARPDCWSRSRIGFKLGDRLNVGPEAILSTDRTGFGLAATGVRLGRLELEAAGGLDRPWRTSRLRPYGSLAIIGRF